MEPEKVLVDSAGGINLRKILRVQRNSSFLSTALSSGAKYRCSGGIFCTYLGGG